MNRKLIFKAAFLNTCVVIASITLGSLIINAFASFLFNVNVEDHLFVIALLAGLPVSFYAFQKADSKKMAHAAAIYLLTQVLVGFVIFVFFLLLFLSIKIYCSYNSCNIIPFL